MRLLVTLIVPALLCHAYASARGTEDHGKKVQSKVAVDLGGNFNNEIAHNMAHMGQPAQGHMMGGGMQMNGSHRKKDMPAMSGGGYMNGGGHMNGNIKMNGHDSTIQMGEAVPSHKESHECDRECTDGPRNCVFDFEVKWSLSMSSKCGNCPIDKQDCFNKGCIPVDGYKRPIIVINEQFPGPGIRVCQGDNITVNVQNSMRNEEGITIHWHGLHQRGTQYMDGVSMLTQCPIPAMTSFMYKFKAEPAGTHWYHAHSGLQRADGLAGSLIVRPRVESNPHAELYDIDSSDNELFIMDWTHTIAITKLMLHHFGGASSKPDTLLINGRRKGGYVTGPSGILSSTPRHHLEVESGKRYRMRAISATWLFCSFNIFVENHVLTVISTDGMDVIATELTNITMHSGERFDFVINANQPPSNYFIRVMGLGDCRGLDEHAVMRYRGPHVSPPEEFHFNFESEKNINPIDGKESDDTKSLLELTTIPNESVDYYNRLANMEAEPDERHFIGIDYQTKASGHGSMHHSGGNHAAHRIAQLNKITFKFPDAPMLTQPQDVDPSALCNVTHMDPSNCETGLCSCTHVINVKHGNLVEFVLFDEGGRFQAGHPFHLHGHPFAVIAMDSLGKGFTEATLRGLIENNEIRYKPESGALLKDTVVVPNYGYTVIRIVAENPGLWLFHCHMQFHSASGMALIVNVPESDSRPFQTPEDFPRCGSNGQQPNIVR